MEFTVADARRHIPEGQPWLLAPPPDVPRPDPDPAAQYDVIVVGGGPAGIGAAVMAAREGARTLLLEARSFFGRVAQVGLWMPMNRLFRYGESRGGVHDMFVAKVREFGEASHAEQIENKYARDGLDIHPDYLRLAAYRVLEEAGCHYRTEAPVVEVTKRGDAIDGVVVMAKEGAIRFGATIVIDTSGDGDVAFRAGVPTKAGRDEDGLMLPISLSFAICNTDAERALEHINEHREEFRAAFDAARSEGGYATAKWYFYDRTSIPGVLSVNNGGPFGEWMLDGTRGADVGAVLRVGTEIAVDFVRIARKWRLPGVEDCHLMRISPHPGVRESRRIVGEYVFEEEDATVGTEFSDSILLRFGEHIDGQYFTKPTMSGHRFPYRSLVPLGVENLLVAGRCASYSHTGAAAGRSMGNMMGMGQAAGAAAAICAREGLTPRRVDVAMVQERLKSYGVDVGV